MVGKICYLYDVFCDVFIAAFKYLGNKKRKHIIVSDKDKCAQHMLNFTGSHCKKFTEVNFLFKILKFN